MTNPFQQMITLRDATLSARERTGDMGIGTQTKAGQVQVIRVTYDDKGRSTLSPLSAFVSFDQAVQVLEQLQK